jgi:hypothetical protein
MGAGYKSVVILNYDSARETAGRDVRTGGGQPLVGTAGRDHQRDAGG